MSLLVCAVIAGGCVSSDQASAARAPAVVKVTACERGPELVDRSVEFRGSMRRVPGTRRMWMRFTLQERAPDGQFAKVVAPGLGVWRKSNPGVSRFAHRQKVLALGRGTAYRSIVHFRWYGEKSAPVKRRVRRSELCRQPEPLANLRVARLGGKPVAGQPGTTRYVLRIGNDGRLASPWTDVRLTVDGSTIDTVTAAPIEPGLERRIVVTGPSCSSSVGVRIDPANVVRERTKRDNSRSIDCPVP